MMVDDVRVLGLAEALASGAVTCATVSIELARINQVSLKCAKLAHFLQHYVADEDIRARDDEYAQWQLAELLRLIADCTVG
jgi:hypothetical protein